MKKVAIITILVLFAVSGFGQTGNQWNIVIDQVATDSMYVWKPMKTDGYMQLQFDVTSFGVTDSVVVDVYYLFKDRFTDEYVPVQIELGVTDVLPLTISRKPYAGNGALAIMNGDSTYAKSVKIENFLGDALGILVTKTTAEAGDTLKVRLRK
jgi:hypothetical protein